MLKRLTVVMPTLNQSEFIARSVRSVCNQLSAADQLIVVDGGSNDGTLDVLRSLKYPQLVVHQYVGSTQAQAIAWGMQNFPAQWACYLNSDDLLLPTSIERALDYLNNNKEVGLVYSNRIFIDDEDRVMKLWQLPRHIDYLMARWDYIPQETSFWKYEAMEIVGGFDPNVEFAVDYDFYLRLMKRVKFVRLNAYFGAFRVHNRSKTQVENESVGKPEVARMQRQYKVRTFVWDRILGGLLRRYIEWCSNRIMSRELTNSLQQQIYAAYRE